MVDKRMTGLDVVTGVTGAGLALLTQDPFAILGVAGAVPVVRELAAGALQALDQRREQRAEAVLVAAAEYADLTVDELVGRLRRSAEGEELLCAVLRSARDAALSSKLYALASALVSSARDETTVTFESSFVRALTDLDVAAVVVLECFLRTANDLGLGSGEPDFDKPVAHLNDQALKRVVPAFAGHLDPILAVLQRHGLIVPMSSGGGAFLGGGGQRIATWTITEFGRTTVQRLAAVGDLLR